MWPARRTRTASACSLRRSKRFAEKSPPSLGVARHVERPFAHVPEDGSRLDEAEKERGNGLRIGVGPYLPVSLSLSDNRGHLVQVVLYGGEHPRAAIGPSDVHVLREDDARQCAVFPDESDVPHQESPKTLDRVGCFGLETKRHRSSEAQLERTP